MRPITIPFDEIKDPNFTNYAYYFELWILIEY